MTTDEIAQFITIIIQAIGIGVLIGLAIGLTWRRR